MEVQIEHYTACVARGSSIVCLAGACVYWDCASCSGLLPGVLVSAGVGVSQPHCAHTDCQQVPDSVQSGLPAVLVTAVAVPAGLSGAQLGCKGSNGQVSICVVCQPGRHWHMQALACVLQLWSQTPSILQCVAAVAASHSQ